jgi:hypothetical protein
MEEHVTASRGDDGESEFEFGLDLILDGLEKIRVGRVPVRVGEASDKSSTP